MNNGEEQMSVGKSRIAREKKTVQTMIEIYCKKYHVDNNNLLCSECQELLEYAITRLNDCPFQEKKTTCKKCSVHCYSPDMRTQIRTIMKYSGPRMLFKKPILAIYHLIDGHKKTI